MLITAIVPRLPPAVDGVGDYALQLARTLRLSAGLTTEFIVGESSWDGDNPLDHFAVLRPRTRSANELKQLLPTWARGERTVLVHYVGYGYARRGCPVWIVDALEQWRRATPGARLVTMFHEVYASGSPWTSAFWLSPWQRRLAARLAAMSDAVLTSKQGYAELLKRLGGNAERNIPAMPVFSSIGEPTDVPPLARRSSRMVVFGGRGNRARVYNESLAALEHAVAALGIREIVDIGPSTGLGFQCVGETPLVERGELPAAEVSSILLDSIAGFFSYPIDYLAKSTIFATYCAHAVIPVGVSRLATDTDGLTGGVHYWRVDHSRKNWDEVRGQTIADNALRWYNSHRLEAQAKIFAAHLCGKLPVDPSPNSSELHLKAEVQA